jgi:glycosyltransferase involved in cell wall biosynthesis
MPLRIAAKVPRAEHGYFNEKIKPMIDGDGVELIGEVNEQTKQDFLAGAAALLFPIEWPEPFGLVMIEAMACGTPVLAFRCGSVPEVIDEGVTGFVVDSVHQALKVMGPLLALDRRRVRRRFEERFTAARMARDYLRLYEMQLGTRERKSLPRPVAPKSILLPAPGQRGAEQPVSISSAFSSDQA